MALWDSDERVGMETHGSTAARSIRTGAAILKAIAERDLDSGSLMYVSKDLDRVAEALIGNETPVLVTLATDQKGRTGALVISDERLLFQPHNAADPRVLTLGAVGDILDDQDEITIVTGQGDWIFSRFLDSDARTATKQMLADPSSRAQVVARERELELESGSFPPPSEAPVDLPHTDEKKCPACLGWIPRAAIACMHCGHRPDRASGLRSPLPGTNVMAVASLVCSLIWLGGLGSIAAVVLGNMAQKEIENTGESGEGLATAGVVLGWIGIIVMAIMFLSFCSVASNSGVDF